MTCFVSNLLMKLHVPASILPIPKDTKAIIFACDNSIVDTMYVKLFYTVRNPTKSTHWAHIIKHIFNRSKYIVKLGRATHCVVVSRLKSIETLKQPQNLQLQAHNLSISFIC